MLEQHHQLPETSDVIVVGGGIVGLSTAFFLAKSGVDVTLIERDDGYSGASSGNAGLIAVGHPPLPRPGLTAKALRWLLDRKSPLYIPPRLDPALIQWLWKFHRACTSEHEQYCMDVLVDLGTYSRACFDELLVGANGSLRLNETGWMDVYRTPQGHSTAHDDADILSGYGLEAERMTGDEVRDRHPAIRCDVLGAVRYCDSASVDPKATLQYVTSAVVDAGAHVCRGTAVERVLVSDDQVTAVQLGDGTHIRAGTVVLAAGIWTTELARDVGVRILMQAGKGYHVEVSAIEGLSTAAVLSEVFVAATPMPGRLRLAGTMEMSGINHRLVQRRLDLLTERASLYINGLDGTPKTTWCGLRPCTADGLPAIGAAPRVRGLYIGTGHAKMGFALGPGTGKILADLVQGRTPAVSIDACGLSRF